MREVMTGITVILIATASFAEAQGYCTATAKKLYTACGFEVQDDYSVAAAKCLNVSDRDERSDCYDEAKVALEESRKECREQLKWRRQACALLGEDRYDPDFDPASFETDFTNLAHPNAYFPLAIGNKWEYRGGGEVNTVEVLDETKLIDGVTCVVFNDLVYKNGELVEDTDDWFAQHMGGNVWYCGEEVKDYESFVGDDPPLPELVSIDGSFKAGRDNDKPGIIFLASPIAGGAYLEEFSLGNAEDVTEVLSIDYAYGTDPDLDLFVPQDLAVPLCAAGDCVVTRNFSLLEPGVEARKYYASGIGFVLEVNPETGEILQLVDCNFDARCATLPPAP